ncbi:MAG TPA: TIM-barrel domain-containing protein [Steroidobacteraceae bacterium]|nr:TIM-barrel domain-containing protein [Steroidobacteraceae bacterium]
MSPHAPRLRSVIRLLVTVLIGLLSACSRTSGPTVVAGNARFEFLTPWLVRMEYARSGAFVDAPTAVVEKRDWPEVRVQTTRKDGWLVASTADVRIRYKLESGEFSATNLEVTWKDRGGVQHAWRPGDKDPLNLGGLPYSLDNISQDNLPKGRPDTETPVNDTIPGIDLLLAQAKPGLLSRAGYAFLDDSRTPVWNAQRTWIEPRAGTSLQDWYFFQYNSDYQRVLREYAQLCGPVPMIPRYALGPMVTDLNFEYFPGSEQSRSPQFQHYDQQYLEDEVSRMRQNHIPFDTLVLDFAWHNYGWDGGYDWSPLIAHPRELSSWLHSQGVKLSLNDHPGYINTEESILSFSDSHAPQVLKDLGRAEPLKPSFNLDISELWSFAYDPSDKGLSAHWYADSARGVHWKHTRVGPTWQEQGFDGGRGFGWYRAVVRLPAQVPAKLYLYLGEVRKAYRIFVNGREATPSSIHWPERLTYTDITPYVHPGRDNLIVLRVEPGEAGGGLVLGPVAIRDVMPPKRIYFDLSNEQQAEVFMRDLHEPLMREGVDFWWVDGGSGAVDMPGLNKQLWTNKVFYDFTQQHTGRRGFILARYGDWGSERYPAFFTGDTYSQWPVLAYEVAFTARGGNVLMPYISHDIGGFHGTKIDFDLYARWIEFGTFSPLLRMHSAHENPREGNLRMPWVYGDQGIALMKKYFTLRTQLIPYIYTYVWQAHQGSMPVLRPLYLRDPDNPEAYRHSHEYLFGDEMLVAPVLDPSGMQVVYLPPGQWENFFTGQRHEGGSSFTAHYGVDETPVFVREGAVIPEQPPSDYSDAHPLDKLILNVYGSGQGSFELYEDDGSTRDFDKGAYALTALRYNTSADGAHHLTIGPATGSFKGQVPERSYELHIHAGEKPTAVSVDGRASQALSWDSSEAIAVVQLAQRSIRDRIEVTWK